MGNEGQGSRRDHLTATTPEGKIELTEEELSRAAGGAVAGDLSATDRFIRISTTSKGKTGTFE
jgi:hypothetical protein